MTEVTVTFVNQAQTIFKNVNDSWVTTDSLMVQAEMEGKPFVTSINKKMVLMSTTWPEGVPDFMKSPEEHADEIIDKLFNTDGGLN